MGAGSRLEDRHEPAVGLSPRAGCEYCDSPTALHGETMRYLSSLWFRNRRWIIARCSGGLSGRINVELMYHQKSTPTARLHHNVSKSPTQRFNV